MTGPPAIDDRTVSAVAPESAAAEPERAAIADGHHLARGAAANALVLVAANFRGVFTFLIARLLGEAGLGRFSLVYATVDALSKVATLGLDSSLVPLVARSEAGGDRRGSRRLFVQAVVAGFVASIVLVVVSWPALTWIARSRRLEEFSRGGVVMLLALPGIAVARISTAASRGVLSMRSEFYSRGLAETWITTGVFLVAVALGIRDAAPSLAVAVGSGGGAIVAFVLAARAIHLDVPGGLAMAPPVQGRR